MSYIYAVYFPQQKAVKIGKADELKTRLSQLVATWGPISKARAWCVEDIFVLGAEKGHVYQIPKTIVEVK